MRSLLLPLILNYHCKCEADNSTSHIVFGIVVLPYIINVIIISILELKDVPKPYIYCQLHFHFIDTFTGVTGCVYLNKAITENVEVMTTF